MSNGNTLDTPGAAWIDLPSLNCKSWIARCAVGEDEPRRVHGAHALWQRQHVPLKRYRLLRIPRLVRDPWAQTLLAWFDNKHD